MNAARLVASACGVGFLPKAPGTWGSLAAVLAGAALLAAFGQAGLAVAAALAMLGGFWAIPRAGGDADPGWVVIDEVVGMWLAMLPLQRPGWRGCVLAFACFRLLDITKPGPIALVDRVPGRIGVMGDDVLAGLVAAALVWAAQAAGWV